MERPLHIMIAATEIAPMASAGLLGDFIQQLSMALTECDHKVTVIVPDYSSFFQDLTRESLYLEMAIPISDRTELSDIYRVALGKNLTLLLINNKKYFGRDGIYRDKDGEFTDNSERFIYYCRAVMEILGKYPDTPDIVYCHNWQSALLPLYIHRIRKVRESLRHLKTVFSIHNMAYQGLFWRFDMHLTGLPWDYFTPSGIEFYGDLNFLKSGIIFSDALTTMSVQYAKDIQTSEHGCGLDGLVREHRKKLTGVINGIDYSQWNPESDQRLAAKFSQNNPAGKSVCKIHLQKKLHLEANPEIPICFFISELTPQKGADLLESVLPSLMKRPVQVIVCGSGHEHYTRQFVHFAITHQGKFAFIENGDEATIHEIVAGGDMHLIPSRYEPCGVNQLFSLSYGAVPVVKTVGGFMDIIRSFRENGSGGYSFTFDDYSTYDFLECIDRGIQTFRNADIWQTLRATAMTQRFTWQDTATEYITIFNRLAQSNE